MTGSLPTHLRDQVIRRVYEDAARLDWLHLSSPDRSRQYQAWLNDPAVGGVLVPILGRDRARLWLKDGPLKEYSRALAGAGSHAKYVAGNGSTASEVALAAMGPDWNVVPASEGIKPLHCVVESAGRDERSFLTWGASKDFKHLLWAALRAVDDSRTPTGVVVIVESLLRPTRSSERDFQARTCRRCGLEVRHITLPE